MRVCDGGLVPCSFLLRVPGAEGQFTRGRVIRGAHSDVLRNVVPDPVQVPETYTTGLLSSLH